MKTYKFYLKLSRNVLYFMNLYSFLKFQTSFDGKTNFTKIHAPYEVILRTAEVMEMKPPVKEFYVTFYKNTKNTTKSNSKSVSLRQI